MRQLRAGFRGCAVAGDFAEADEEKEEEGEGGGGGAGEWDDKVGLRKRDDGDGAGDRVIEHGRRWIEKRRWSEERKQRCLCGQLASEEESMGVLIAGEIVLPLGSSIAR